MASSTMEPLPSKKVALEDLTKEELVQKYKRLVLYAQKANQAKEDSALELESAKENETKLQHELSALKEIAATVSEKQKEVAEVENKMALINKKNSGLEEKLEKSEMWIAQKNEEVCLLRETLTKLNSKISEFEIRSTEDEVKLKDFKIKMDKLLIENSDLENKNRELLCKLKSVDEKYSLVDQKLAEFQDKYIEEKRQHAKLQNELERKLEEKCERSSAESRETLPTVSENQEAEVLSEKINESALQIKNLEIINSQLNKRCTMLESLVSKNAEEESNINEGQLTIAKLSENVEKFENRCSFLESGKEQLAVSLVNEKGAILTLKSRNFELEQSLEAIKAGEENLRSLKIDADRQIRDLQSALATLSEQSERKCNDYELQNKNLVTEIKHLNDYCNTLKVEKEGLTKLLNESVAAVEYALKTEHSSEDQPLLVKDSLSKNETPKSEKPETCQQITSNENKLAEPEIEKASLLEEHTKTCLEYESRITCITEKLNVLIDRKNSTISSLSEEFNEKLRAQTKQFSLELEAVKKECENKLNMAEMATEEKENFYKLQLEGAKSKVVVAETTLATLANEKKCLEEAAANRKNNDVRVSQLQSVIESLNEKLEVLRIENQTADSKFLELEKQLQDSKQVSDDLEARVSQSCEEYDAFKDRMENYNIIVTHLKRLKEDVGKIKEEFEKLKNNAKLEIMAAHQTQNELSENLPKVFSDFVCKLTEGNSELLGEMNMMNQALKERGSRISKLEEEVASSRALVTENDGKLKKTVEKFESAQCENQKLHTEVEEKEKCIKDMEKEIWRLQSQDNSNDTLSTSTISKAEESSRLVELEESFEDKYNKLKIFAVKQKRKIFELQNQFEHEKTKLMNEREEFQSKITQFQSQNKSLQTLQVEYDKMQDQCDLDKKQISDLRKSLEKVREESIVSAKSLEEVKMEREKFKQEKASFEIIKKELNGQIQGLKKAVEKEQNKVKEFGKERERYETEIQLREKRLEEESERHKATHAKVQSQKLEQKKHSLLSLEMADYEKTATDLSKRLETKDTQIRELESNLETQRNLSKSLQESVFSLESRLALEQQVTDASKLQTNSLQDNVFELKREINGKAVLIADLERTCEEKKLEAEKLTIEAAELSAEMAKFEERCRTQNEKFSREIRGLEDKVSQQNDLIERKDLELTELKKEFGSYKIRAQSVLRQSQKDLPSSRHQDIEEELKVMRTTSDNFRSKLEEVMRRSQVLQEEHHAITEEKARLFHKVQELMRSLADLRAVNAELQTAELRAKEEGEECARLLRVQLETLSQVYKKEIDEREAGHKKEVEELRTALDQAEKKLHLHIDIGYKEHRRNPSTGKAETPSIEHSGHRRQHSANFVPVKTERETLDVLMLEREACEGSESVDSASPRLVPLDQLLAPPSTTVDVAALTDRLDKCENRIHHLTTLLSDAESDAARLQQLNEVLKEEIRRKERNEAREQHANNLEYLKNIVVKFATLPRGDERLRLVPVLNTILRLSPEEETKLSKVARVGAEPAGWGTYIGGMWSGGQ